MRTDCGITASRWAYYAPQRRGSQAERDPQIARLDPCFEITCRTCRKYHPYLFKYVERLDDEEDSLNTRASMTSR
jgi:hypothetical protein